MKPRPPDRTGDNLHRPIGVVTPGSGLDLVQPRVAGREQRRLPAEQAFPCERRIIMCRRVEHHLDDAFGPPIRLRNCRGWHAEAPGDRGSHAIAVEDVALDLRAFDDVLRSEEHPSELKSLMRSPYAALCFKKK